jgi:peptide/nickel transport system substrate-binding protein
MRRYRTTMLTAVGVIAALTAAACGGSSGSGGSHTSFDNTTGPDSTDPGNTYYAFNLNFTRLYATPLITYKSCPGKCGLAVVPGLATSLGVPSDGDKTWTYHLKPGVKFENGMPVTSADVKYAVERTFDRAVIGNGPSYFSNLLAGNAATYPGPYKDRSKNIMGLTAIATPNPLTVVFHLNRQFPDFNYVAAFPQTAPVPPSMDTGSRYQLHPLSTGPYKFQSYELNKQYVLVPNPVWKQSWDPQVNQLASKIIVNLNVNAADIDNRLIAGDIQMDQAGTGVQSAARARILSSPVLRAHSDDPITGFENFFYIDAKVPPLNNIHCREAVEFAANKNTLQTAYGGPYGGSIASTAMPPTVTGYAKFDYYHALSDPNGDISAAKAQLKACGHPSGFSTNIAYRSDRPREVASATALQAALASVGIHTTLKGFTAASYYSTFAGVPAYVHSHQLGILAGGWGPDWPNCFGWGWALFDSKAIVSSGNANLGELSDPKVDNWFSAIESPTASPSARAAYCVDIDKQVMKDAVLLPAVYSRALLYRSPALTNVYVQPYYGMYDYSTLGVKP